MSDQGSGPDFTKRPPEDRPGDSGTNSGADSGAPAWPSYEQPSYGQPSYGEAASGQPTYRPPPSGQEGGTGQPPYAGYGQPQGYAQGGYGQPGYSQPGYSQPGYSQPGYGPPVWGQPGYPQAGWGAPQTDGTAIAGLVCAIASFLVCPVVLAIVALILAHNSDRTIRAAGGQRTGHGLNTAARWIAWVNIALSVLAVVGLIAAGVFFASSTSTSTY